MTNDDLLAAIKADSLAKSMAEAGNDSGVAARISEILPKVHVATKLDEELILRRLGAVLGDGFLRTLESLAASQPGTPEQTAIVSIAKRTVRLLTERDGIDFGSANVLALIDSMPFTDQQKDIIRGLSLVNQVIDPSQVSECLQSVRMDGKVGPIAN